MIILKRLFTISISLLALCACETGDNNLPSRPDDDDNYVGTMVVDQNDGTTYTDSAAGVSFITPSPYQSPGRKWSSSHRRSWSAPHHRIYRFSRRRCP